MALEVEVVVAVAVVVIVVVARKIIMPTEQVNYRILTMIIPSVYTSPGFS